MNTENNKLIAEFMGADCKTHDCLFNPAESPFLEGEVYYSNMLYNQSWDWLIPVALKCVKTAEEMQADEWVSSIQMSVATPNSTIKTAFKEVVDFIEWKNNHIEDLEADGWVCTDPDCNQYRKDLGDNKFLFREDRIDDIELETKEVYESEIDLEDYPWSDIISKCQTFGYTAKQVDDWLNTGEESALIAECIFELES